MFQYQLMISEPF